MKESRALRQKRAAIIQEMHDLTERTSFPDEAQRRWKSLDEEQKKLTRDIAKAESKELADEMRELAPQPPAAQVGDPRYVTRSTPPQQDSMAERRDLRPFLSELRSEEYREAFLGWVRRGENGLSREQHSRLTDLAAEVRTYSGLNEGTGSQGGYLVPIGFQRELETKLKAYGRMRAACRILNTSTGNTLDWPTMDDTTQQGEFLSEASPVSQQNPSFGQVQFEAFLASSKQVLVSVQVLQDSAIDLEGELTTAFAIRIGRVVNNKYTLGSGTGEPQGLVYAIQNDASPNVVNAIGANSNTGNSGDTEANSVGTDDLDDLISAVDQAYRPGAKFMMHWKSVDVLRKLKDKYGRPLWVSGLSANTPDSIYGYPFEWNSDMDVIGAGKYPILFGDFSKHVIRDVGGLTMVRYNELYMPNHQVGFQAFLRTDSRRMQQAAFALLYNPLS